MNRGLSAWGLLLKWQFLRLRRQIAMIVVIQCALGLGIVYGLSFLLPGIDSRSALFLSTGAPTIALLMVGLSVVPQEVIEARLTGREEYQRSLPVPRLTALAAEVTFWVLAQLPGMALTVVFASIRFRFPLDLRWSVIPALALVSLSAASVGYAFAMSFKPEVARQLTSFITIGILLFSPINFPADQLPHALQSIHVFLPVKYMADLVRWSLTGDGATHAGLNLAVVSAWCVGGLALSYRIALQRR